MPKKRKAQDDDADDETRRPPSVKKKSKRQQRLEEARASARQWAAAEAQRANTSASNPPKPAVKPKSTVTVVPTNDTVAASPLAPRVSTTSPTEQKTTTTPTPKGEKMTKRQKIMEARARAKAWAESNAPLTAMPSTSTTPKPTRSSGRTRKLTEKAKAASESSARTRRTTEKEEQNDKEMDAEKTIQKEDVQSPGVSPTHPVSPEAKDTNGVDVDGQDPMMEEGKATPESKPALASLDPSNRQTPNEEHQSEQPQPQLQPQQPPAVVPTQEIVSKVLLNGGKAPIQPRPTFQTAPESIPIRPPSKTSAPVSATTPVVQPPRPRRESNEDIPHSAKDAKTTTPYSKGPPPSEDMGTDADVADSQTNLEKLIQEQVMVNALASASSPVATMDLSMLSSSPSTKQPIMYDDEPVPVTNTRRPYLMCVAIVFVSLCGFLVVLLLAGATGSAPVSAPTGLPPCFISTNDDDDKPTGGVEDIEPECVPGSGPGVNGTCPEPSDTPQKVCDDTVPAVECPKWSICAGGLLESCPSPSRQPSVEGNACVFTAKANESLALIEESVINWTLQYHCDSSGCDFAEEGTGVAPVFPITRLPMPYPGLNSELIEGSEILTKSRREDGSAFVGLTEEYFSTRLEFPVLCQLTLVLLSILAVVLEGGSFVFTWVTSSAWSWTVAHPVITFVGLVAVWVARTVHTRRRQRAKLVRDAANVKQMVYEQLMQGPTVHAVLHIRDGVANDMSPNSREGRQYVIKKVWPRVVADIRCDNRVMKANKMIQGTPHDVWKWIATPNKGKKVAFQS